MAGENLLPRQNRAAAACSVCEPFFETLSDHGLELKRSETRALQINVGFLCNQSCRHCHLDAGPDRRETMDRETVRQVISYARRCRFPVVDITGGAPEMNENLERLIGEIAPLAERVILRSNLTAMMQRGPRDLIRLAAAHGVVIVASLPSINATQTDAQRGPGVWEICIDALRMLNDFGYGREGSGMELDLVSNPAGAYLPVTQAQAERRFKLELQRKYGIVFNRLYTFANVPLGRFRDWLESTGNLAEYMARLSTSFNPCTVDSLMCRTLVSVSWDGYLFDCDFNLADGLHFGGSKRHVSEMAGPPEKGTPVITGDHCYACTAGPGFT
ncbi:MAG: radical SAM/Cys-rich domain protein [Deltaproteobacteria bacterium]|nr:radical SAM/Cys-rich domain protein [Deltaproteobacteria bacterium]